MNTVAKKFALAALCTTALVGLSATSQAQVVFDIVGGGAVTAFDYSTAITSNNVVNSVGVPGTGSTVFDPNTHVLGAAVNQTGLIPVPPGSPAVGSSWVGSTGATLAGTAVLSVSGLNPGQNYTIAWTYIGNEAANTNTFKISNTGALVASSSVAGSFTADNRNNNCCFGINPLPTVNMGGTTYTNGGGTVSTPGFTLTDISTAPVNTVTNNGVPGSNPVPNGGAANLIFSYLIPGTHGFQWDLSSTPTNEILVGFNDNGSSDDNHDDFMFIASVTPGGNAGGTPIPGALPLFGSVLGGGLLFRKLRKRRAATA